jgi:D-glycero-D-manno-heptose 1,7-bisphosphate phosphatase
MAGRKALFLDRDGVINHDVGYPHRIEDIHFVDGIFGLARRFAHAGYAIVIATNQSGIGRGLYTEADFELLMSWMRDRFAEQGIVIAAVYYCPDHPTEGIGPYRHENPWRKPGSGMFTQAAADLDLDLAASFSIGDKPDDMTASLGAGIGHPILFSPDAPPAAGGASRVIRRLDDLVPPGPAGG